MRVGDARGGTIGNARERLEQGQNMQYSEETIVQTIVRIARTREMLRDGIALAILIAALIGMFLIPFITT